MSMMGSFILAFKIVIVFVCIDTCWGQCCYSDSGADGCAKCFCHDPSEVCNYTTGECEGGCKDGIPAGYPEYKWTGTGCQIGNVAAYKPANASFVMNGPYGTPGAATDGILGDETNNDFCAKPWKWGQVHDEIWLEVDLGENYLIHTVYIHNDNISSENVYQHMINFHLIVKSSTGDSVYTTYTSSAPHAYVPRGGVYTWELDVPAPGRYIRFEKDTPIVDVTICEIVVMGQVIVDDCPQTVPLKSTTTAPTPTSRTTVASTDYSSTRSISSDTISTTVTMTISPTIYLYVFKYIYRSALHI